MAKVLQFPRRKPYTIQEVTALARADIRAAAKRGELPGSWRDYSVTCHWAGYVVPVLDIRVKGWPAERVWRLPGVVHHRNQTEEAEQVGDALLRMAFAHRERAYGYDVYVTFDSDPWKRREPWWRRPCDTTSELSAP